MVELVRVRYAPSPTGAPHVGNIRTALFNWLYARHTGGTFILRIEDTDQARSVEGAQEAIFASLQWLGLEWDEGPEVGGSYGPYTQSARLLLYQDTAQLLLQDNTAYRCFCTQDELAEMRKAQQKRGEPPRYDRRCRDLNEIERKAKEAAGLPNVVRFKTPIEGPPITVTDKVRGKVVVEVSTLDDFVLLKSDGFPTYHLANVVDDHAMQVTHVFRGEEWLPSTPRHLLLYEALGYEPPSFAHLPMILGPDRTKLAKRHGASSLMDYQAEGYLPDAMFNFLALLGWSLDDKTEIMSKDDLVSHFTPDRIVKSPAIFNIEKLAWMNGLYIRNIPQDSLATMLQDILANSIPEALEQDSFEPLEFEYIRSIVPLVQDRLRTLNENEVWDLCSFFLIRTLNYQILPPIPKGLDSNTARIALTATVETISFLNPFDIETIETALRTLADRLELKTSLLFGAIRLAVTGRTAAPPLFATLEVLGKKRILDRLQLAIKKLAQE